MQVILTLNYMFNNQIPLKFYTDSKSMFDSIIGINPATGKRLLIDLFVIGQS